MPIQPRAAIARVNPGLEPAQLRTRWATGMPAICSARKARTSARSASHPGGSTPQADAQALHRGGSPGVFSAAGAMILK